MNRSLPTDARMYAALEARDPDFEGRFLAAVRTTGVFCRPTCPARTPLARNVAYFSRVRDAVLAGYRPCLRCRPLSGESAPGWLDHLLARVQDRPGIRWRDAHLRELGLDPFHVREWFVAAHGLTFHAYARARAVGAALGPGRQGRGKHAAEHRTQAVRDLFGPAGADGERGPGAAEMETATPRAGGPATAASGVAGPTTATAPDGGPDLVAEGLPTPLGLMVAVAGDDGLCLLEFADRAMLRTQIRTLARRLGARPRPGSNRWTRRTQEELDEYFGGLRSSFTVPLVTPGTPFQERVWAELARIPAGRTVSYRELAATVERPTAVRAVGRANGQNRISILLPCHRVVGADGALRGYGGGLWRKEALLALERPD